MKFTTILIATSTLLHGHGVDQFSSSQLEEPTPEVTSVPVTSEDEAPPLIRINSTVQSFNAGQPWQRNSSKNRRGTGILISPTQVLTVAELVADQTFLEFEAPDSSDRVRATVSIIDYKSNLAILEPANTDDLGFLGELSPIELGEPAAIGDDAIVWQLEYNGTPLKTKGLIRGVDTVSTFLPGFSFLCYNIKGSMQSSSSSFSLPVTRGGKLLGLLTAYDSDDQLSTVIAPEIIATFLEDVGDGHYDGFPSLGVASEPTEDSSFRDYLKLGDEMGGVYLSRIKPGMGADKAGLQVGDVLTAIDGSPIDRRGYYEHPSYGILPWTVLIRGEKFAGDQVRLEYLRDGEVKEVTATLTVAEDPLVPRHIHDSAPPFLIKGGLVFQELSSAYLRAYGENWTTRAPLDLMHVLHNQKDYEEGRERVVFLSRIIPNPATVGYDSVNSQIITSANGQEIKDLKSLADALAKAPADGIHTIGLSDAPHTLYLDAQLANLVDQQLLQSGLPMLSRMSEDE
ncbi:MAG: PDZ domain-containing protein [Verrucomicrobiota bacterium JB023]|nr:PDZ domain-containing protein [Verrucomicrobiota bacterium JB023]